MPLFLQIAESRPDPLSARHPALSIACAPHAVTHVLLPTLAIRPLNWGRMSHTSPRMLQTFFSVHGENALFVAKEFYKTNAVLKKLGNPGTLQSIHAGRASNAQH